MYRILLSPHSDDECLFAAYSIIRHPTLVIVCTDYDGTRGPSAEERRQESVNAMRVLGAPIAFLGIPESKFSGQLVHDRLQHFNGMFDLCLAPAHQGGHKHHDEVSLYGRGPGYATYTKDNLKPFGDIEIAPTDAEFQLKKRALACYKSQWKLNPQHFEAVLEARSEFYVS